MKIRAFVAVVLLLGVFAALGCPQVNTTGLSTGPQFLQQVCTKCHSLERVCLKLGAEQGAWEKTLNKMNRYGANLDDSQFKTMLNYAANLQPGAKPPCE